MYLQYTRKIRTPNPQADQQQFKKPKYFTLVLEKEIKELRILTGPACQISLPANASQCKPL